MVYSKNGFIATWKNKNTVLYNLEDIQLNKPLREETIPEELTQTGIIIWKLYPHGCFWTKTDLSRIFQLNL